MKLNIFYSIILLSGFSKTFSQCNPYGPWDPGTTASVNSGTSWSNPNDAITSDDNYASSGLLVTIFGTVKTKDLQVTSFEMSIPASATICGIEFRVERSAGGLNILHPITDGSVKIIKNGTVAGPDHAIVGGWTGSDFVQTYGGVNDLWGQSWLPSDFNSGFGLSFSAQLAGAVGLFSTAQVDHIEVVVYYDNFVLDKKLNYFSVTAQKDRANLYWTISNDNSIEEFTIERAPDYRQWKAIGLVKTNYYQSLYQFTDVDPSPGVNYYRLRIKSNSGNKFSNIIQANLTSETGIRVYPNPAKSNVVIESKRNVRDVQIKDLLGRTIKQIELDAINLQNLVDVSDLKPGLYILQANGETVRFLKN